MCIDVHTPVRIAVIGCGNFGQHHARCLAASPEFELVGVCDRVIERAEALAHVHGVDCAEHISGLTRTPEAVCVVVPPEGHGELVDDCMSRGLHVLVEKPFGVDPMVVAALNEKAGASGRILHVGYLERYHDAVNLAAARVKRPTHIRCVRIAPHDAGRFAACDTLHVVLDLMSHDIDHVLRLVGSDPISVTTLAPSASRPPAELTPPPHSARF
jgi:virulence factor